ncbi:MAG: NACHT domain-containing protein [Caldilinea sp. CFX5]|nr:NACHT domain-containing protein [Caldilinea sp. CFX5]
MAEEQTWGAKLKQIRERCGYSQAELAEKISELLRDLSTDEEQKLRDAGIELPDRDFSNVTINRYENNPRYTPAAPKRHWFLIWALTQLGAPLSLEEVNTWLSLARQGILPPALSRWFSERDNAKWQASSRPSELRLPSMEVQALNCTFDLHEAPQTKIFFGRQVELAQLQDWVMDGGCRLIAVLGTGGIGKSALIEKFVRSRGDQATNLSHHQFHYKHVIWRSLLNAPPLQEIIQQWLLTLSHQQITVLPANLDECIRLLLNVLKQQRVLLILDNVESILQGNTRAGLYRVGYEAYGQLFQRMAQTEHQSCLLLTSRECPRNIQRLVHDVPFAKSLQVKGLLVMDVQKLLLINGLHVSDTALNQLVIRYSGNPLALKLVIETIQDLYAGNISAFLGEGTLIFDDIRDVLDQQVARLSALEQEILIWLAIARDAITESALWHNLMDPPLKHVFIEALRSLQRRSLIETVIHADEDNTYKDEYSALRFTLQHVVIEYFSDHLITVITQEIEYGQLDYLQRYALIQAQAQEYIRASQTRLILAPVADHLLHRLGKGGFAEQMKQILTLLRQSTKCELGYGGGNVLNLLRYADIDLSGCFFSNLTIRQAYLQGMNLSQVDFANSNLLETVLTDTFGAVFSVAFSPDGKQLAAGTSDRQIHIWQAATGQPLVTLAGHTGFVRMIAFNPKGDRLVSGSEDQTVAIWDMQTGQCTKILRGHLAALWAVRYSPDGHTIASISDDQVILLWDVNSGHCTQILQSHPNPKDTICFSPDGRLLASGSADRSICLWDVRTGQCIRTFPSHTHALRSLCFSHDCAILASGSVDQSIRLWAVNTGQCVKIWRGYTKQISSLCFASDSKLLISGSADGMICLWDLQQKDYTPESTPPLRIFQGHRGAVRSLSVSPDGKTLASGSEDQTVRLWNIETGDCLRIFSGYANPVWSLSFCSDGAVMATGNDDQTVQLFNVDTGTRLKRLVGHTGRVSSVCFDSNGTILVSGSHDRTIRCWNVHTGQCTGILGGHDGPINSVCCSPNKNR